MAFQPECRVIAGQTLARLQTQAREHEADSCDEAALGAD